jgi:hypothetical protein
MMGGKVKDGIRFFMDPMLSLETCQKHIFVEGNIYAWGTCSNVPPGVQDTI